MASVTYASALGAALREEMARDERVFIMGEDIQQGIRGITRGLVAEFGAERVRNTPISENAFLGAGIGASATGLIPIVDLLFSNFIYVAMDQVMNQAAKLRYMMGGSANFPVTFLVGTGAPGGVGAHHSDSIHPCVMNSGGVKVILPSQPFDAKGLLKAAIRDQNPVLFLYHNSLGGERGEVPEEEYVLPIGEGRILLEGSDLTISAFGLMAKRALQAAAQLAREGISVEVVDPRTLHPLAYDIVVRSVEKTGLLLSIDEARRTCSGASEITARVCEAAFDALRAAPITLAVPDLPIPFAPTLEREIIPSVERIASTARLLVSKGSGI